MEHSLLNYFSRSKSEIIQQEALRDYYREVNKRQHNKTKIKRCKRFTQVYYPIFCIVFVIMFWAFGMKEYRETKLTGTQVS